MQKPEPTDEKPGASGMADRVGIDTPGEMRGHSMSAGTVSSSLLDRWRLALTAVADVRLSKADVAVLMFLIEHINHTSGEAFPSMARIASLAGLSLRSARRGGRNLIRKGYLDEHPMPGRTTRYRLGTPDKRITPDKAVTPDTNVTPPLTSLSGAPDTRVTPPLTSASPEPADVTHKHNLPIEPTKKRTQKARAGDQDSIGELIGLELPEGLTRENWTAYVKHRAGMPKAKRLTDTSAAMCLRKLRAWAEQGHDPNDIVSTSVANGWQGLIEPKTAPAKRPAGRIATPSQSEADAINELAAARLKKAQARGAA